jgi:hypothetical protein
MGKTITVHIPQEAVTHAIESIYIPSDIRKDSSKATKPTKSSHTRSK